MKKNVVTIVGLIAIAILGTVSAVIYFGQDKTTPVITVEEMDISYTEGDDYEILMQGVSASDDRDGDLTDKVFINSINGAGEGKAIVYYAVIDKAKNVGTETRIVSYIGNIDDEKGTEDSEQGSSDIEENGSDESTENTSEQNLQAPVPDGVRPALALTADEHTISAGTPFNIVSVIHDVVDDVDTSEELYMRLQVSADYDVNTPGRYEIGIFVTDTDGNQSDVIPFTLIVE